MNAGILLPIVLMAALTGAQPAPPRVTRAMLAQAAQPVSEGGNLRELTVQWTAYAGARQSLIAAAGAVAVNQFEVLAQRTVTGTLPQERQPDFSGDQVLVAAVDASGRLLCWQLLPDPRIVRSEGPGPDGILRGTILYRTDPVFTFSFPATVAPAAITVFKPRASGGDWEFDPIASFPAPARQ